MILSLVESISDGTLTSSDSVPALVLEGTYLH
jgi:hypothetical protein